MVRGVRAMLAALDHSRTTGPLLWAHLDLAPPAPFLGDRPGAGFPQRFWAGWESRLFRGQTQKNLAPLASFLS